MDIIIGVIVITAVFIWIPVIIDELKRGGHIK